MPATNVEYNSTPFSPQPTRLVLHPPKAKLYQGLDGAYKKFIPPHGWWWELIWGNNNLASIGDLDTVRDVEEAIGLGTFTLSYVDDDGETCTYTAILGDPVVANSEGGTVEQFTLTVYEAA